MIASKSNVAKKAIITAFPESSINDYSVLTNGDFSSIYSVNLQDVATIQLDFDGEQRIGYMAFGASNISTKTRLVVTASKDAQASDHFVVVDDVDLSQDESCTLFYKLNLERIYSIKIYVYGQGELRIGDIAIGETYELKDGMQSGYNRPWTIPNISQRAGMSAQKSPISLCYEAREIQCSLSIPNNKMHDFNSFYDFARFASANTFYIREDQDRSHSYACFGATVSETQAHSATSLLGATTIKFYAYAKAASEAVLS